MQDLASKAGTRDLNSEYSRIIVKMMFFPTILFFRIVAFVLGARLMRMGTEEVLPSIYINKLLLFM